MELLKKKSILLDSNPSTSLPINNLDYYILEPRGNSNYGQLDYVTSNNCILSTYSFESLAIVQVNPIKGWLSVIIKPYSQLGIGPFHDNVGKSTTIKSSLSKESIWTIDLAGGVYYSISIRASLLAKHALGMVDTSILNTANTLCIDATVTESLIDKFKHIGSTSRSCAELDLRASHLILAICESISDQSVAVASGSRQLLTRKTVSLIQENFLQGNKVSDIKAPDIKDPDIKAPDIKEITKAMNVSKPKLDQAFRSSIGIGLSQFLNAYYLNLIREDIDKNDLSNNDTSLSVYAKRYGYRSTKSLTEEYATLFENELACEKIDS